MSRRPLRDLMGNALHFAATGWQYSGNIEPTALFLYGKDLADLNENTTKVVSINWKNELHKEIIRTRIREKAEFENASAVVLFLPSNMSGPGRGTLLITGAVRSAMETAAVNFVFDTGDRTFSFSDMTRVDEPADTFFIGRPLRAM